jgi:hypothetical protein
MARVLAKAVVAAVNYQSRCKGTALIRKRRVRIWLKATAARQTGCHVGYAFATLMLDRWRGNRPRWYAVAVVQDGRYVCSSLPSTAWRRAP